MNEVTIIGKFVSINGDCFVVKEGRTNHYIFASDSVLEKLKIIPKDTSVKVKAHLEQNEIVANKVFVLIGENDGHEEI